MWKLKKQQQEKQELNYACGTSKVCTIHPPPPASQKRKTKWEKEDDEKRAH